MMAPSPLSFLVISCAILSVSVSSQVITGPGYLACPFLDVLNNTAVFGTCIYENINCTLAQQDVCESGELLNETTSADVLTLYIPLQCDCYVTDGCLDSCEFITVDEVPILPTVTGFVNYTGVGNVTCPIANVFFLEEEVCDPIILDPTSCGTCNVTALSAGEDPNGGYVMGDTTLTTPLFCECQVMLNCPNTCTFVASDSPTVETPIAVPVVAPVAAPSTVEAPVVSAPTAEETVPSVSAPTSLEGNVTAPVSAPSSEEGNVTAPVKAPTKPVSGPSAPVRSPGAAPSKPTSFATVTTSHKVCAVVTVVLTTMMFVSVF